MKKYLLPLICLVSMASFAIAQDKDNGTKDQKITGYLADEKCARADKGASDSHADCTKKCMEAGQKLVLISDSDKKVLNIDNQDAVKEHASHHVTVTGTVTGDTIHVDKVAM